MSHAYLYLLNIKSKKEVAGPFHNREDAGIYLRRTDGLWVDHTLEQRFSDEKLPMQKIPRKKTRTVYCYIIKSDPQLCVWPTEKEAERERKKALGTGVRVSDVFPMPESPEGIDLYQIVEDALNIFACLYE